MGLVDYIKILFTILNVVGIGANGILLIILIRMKKVKRISEDAAVVLMNQAIIDLIISSLAIFYNFAEVSWMPDIFGEFEWIRLIICMGVYTQFPYWAAYCISVFNDVLLAVERFFAVVFPFNQRKFHSLIPGILFLLYTINTVFNFPVMFYNDYDYQSQGCFARHFNGIFIIMRYYGILAFIIYFILPIILFLFFNGLTVKKLMKKNKAFKEQGGNAVKNSAEERKSKAAMMIVKISILLAVSYAFWMSFTNIYYFITSITGIYWLTMN